MAVVFVSHKLHEVAELADRVGILRRGRLVAERRTGEVDPTELANLMMGVAEVDDADTAAAVGLAVTETASVGPRTGARVLAWSTWWSTAAGDACWTAFPSMSPPARSSGSQG